ncbi:MAG: trigger factor [Bacillota bacterium]
MKIEQEKVEENKVKLDVELEEERVEEALDEAYKKVVKKVDIDGFRKGKVPRTLLEKRYGEEVLHKDALDILIQQGYYEAVEEADIEPIAQPEITDAYINGGEPATFTATVEVKPDVDLGEYSGLEVETEDVTVEDEEIEQELETRRHDHAQLVGLDREVVEEGDFTTIDYEGTIDGEPFDGGSAEDYNLEIGSGSFIPGFEEQLIGAQVGEETTVEVEFPEDYQGADLAGEEAEFKVAIKDIKAKEVPELDDEFAKDVGYDNLDELKSDIKNDLEEEAATQADREYENKLVDAAVANAEVNIPEAMVEEEIDNMLEGQKMQMQQQGFDFDQYLEMTGMDEEGLRDNFRQQAVQRVESNLILEAIAEQEEIEVTDEEIDEKVAEIAKSQGQEEQDPEQVKAFLQMQGQLDQLTDGLQMEKTIDFLKENN